jgi:predicted P-loop ATPase
MSIATNNGWGGLVADVEQFPVAVDEATGELLIDYSRVPGKGRYAGKIEATLDQVCRCVESDPDYPYRVAYDQFLCADVMVTTRTGQKERIKDKQPVDMRRWFDVHGWEPVNIDLMRSVINSASKARQTNIAQDWLNSLVWDGVDRYGDMLASMGVVITDYALAVARYQWTSHAARVLHAGYQADAIIVLVGEVQGTGKTQYIRALAPCIEDNDTYRNISIDDLLHSDKAARALMGSLVANLDEMRDFGKRESSEIKAALSRMKESYTPKYKEGLIEFGRSCLIYATNNETEFLDDPTGNRRYHILPVGRVNLEWISENRDQLWAQGREDFLVNGQAWQRALELAAPAQTNHLVSDSWSEVVGQYLETTLEQSLTMTSILTHALQIPLAQQDRRAQVRVGKVMKELGWVKVNDRWSGGVRKVWRKQ